MFVSNGELVISGFCPLTTSVYFKYWAEKERPLYRGIPRYIGVSYNPVPLSQAEYYNHHTRR